MSTLDAIRARVENGQGGDTLTAADRAALLALLDAQSLELQAVREALHSTQAFISTYVIECEPQDDCAKCKQAQRVFDLNSAALKQSRGAT